MRIYWSLRSIPELAHLGNRELGELWRDARWQTFRHWQTWLGLLACGLCAGLGSSLGGPIGAGVGGGVGGAIAGQVLFRVAEPYLVEAARRRGLVPPAAVQPRSDSLR
jgi:hypothetical protein